MVVRYIKTQYLRVKPIFDRVVAAALLAIFAPVIGFCALLVKLTSKGPAFYKQDRVGANGVVFKMLKLRTMRANAEADTGPVWTPDRDERITPVGCLLRRTHIDELPQLVNVLRGDMSLVGPRPERPYFVDKLKGRIPGYENRLNVKPGITGLAQIRCGYDRNVRDVARKVRMDLLYIRRMCWLVDLRILFGTVGKFFRG